MHGDAFYDVQFNTYFSSSLRAYFAFNIFEIKFDIPREIKSILSY